MGASSQAYAVGEKLHAGRRASVYRAVRATDGRRVVLKVLDAPHLLPEDLERLKHEFELRQVLQGLPAVEPLALSMLDEFPALELEDFAGASLERLVGTPLSVQDFLLLAVRVAAAVAEIHARGLIHKELKPGSIFFDPQGHRAKVGDFGVASRVAREQTTTRPGRLIDESLPYVSPEQTGRVNRVVDSRSDLYSLGVTFYQLLTGRLPFEASDAIGWVYGHVARTPPPPDQIRTTLPSMLSEIVLRLLAKVPDERYQSAAGLKYDLERCLQQWQDTGVIAPFTLGERDASDRFLIPQRVYGREAECAALRDAFERAVSTGRPELLLVSGQSGAGKSAVVYELRRSIALRRGLFFLAAKCEQDKRDIPYLPVIRAFRELTLDILAESEDQVAAWRRRIESAVGPSGQLVVDLIPQVQLIIGPQAPVPELPLAEAESRLRTVLRQFVCTFSRPEHPLTLFLDDLQWADPASLNLITDLVANPETRHLLLIGAYRDNEVGPSHPLQMTLDRARAAGAVVSDVAIGPLSQGELGQLVADTVHCSSADAAPLARLMREKTGGNPFFATHFLTALYRKKAIAFDRDAGRWSWDMVRVRAEGHTDDVLDLMVGKLRDLPGETQRALTLAAHLGAMVDAQVMAIVLGRDPEPALRAALDEDLILRIDQTYRFPHDRVQEAAYSLVPEGERAALHLKIGRLLWSRTPPAERAERTFEIVNQINQGASLITSLEEREQAAALNLAAGRRAKETAAYASALKYLAAGTSLLARDEDSWIRCYRLTFELELNRAACEYSLCDLAAAEQRLSALSRRAKTLVDLAAVTCAEVALYASDRSDRAIEVSLAYLRRVGLEWSAHPTDGQVAEEFEHLRRTLGDRQIESLVDLPSVADPDRRATMDVLTWASSPAVFTDANLHCMLVGRLANLSLENGNSDGSCLAYVRLGMLLGPRFGDYAKGFRFGKLGFDLVEKRGLLRFKALVYLDFGHLINPWTRHLSAGLGLVRRAFEAAQETGNLTYACYSLNCLITLLLAKGEPLAEVQQEAESGLAFAQRTKFGLVIDHLTAQVRLIRMLRGLLPAFGSFNDAEFDEGRFERELESNPRLSIATCWYWIRKLEGRFHAGDYAGALEAAAKAEPLLWTSPSFFETAEYHFCGALARAARHDESPPEERPRHLEALVAHHQQLEVWARNGPANFASRAALVSAEVARIEDRALDAERLFGEAIRLAHEGGFVQIEALAYETAASFWRARGFGQVADGCLREALDRYRRWGAEGKVRQLERLHGHLARSPSLPPPVPAMAVDHPTAVAVDQLDLLSVIKASQTISGAMGRDELLRTLLQIVIEQGGARRARLILSRDGELEIAAEATTAPAKAAGGPVILLSRQPTARLPTSILQYAARTQERVLLDDAAADAGRFAADAYLARTRQRSILCLPIRRQAEVVALLYLENDLVPGVFTPERLTALELIAAQAAISLENTLLLEREHDGRVEAEAAGRRALILSEATALVSSTFDYEGVFGALTRLCVRSLAEWAVIDLAEQGQVTRLAGAHRDPANEPLLRELAERYPARIGTPTPVTTVIVGGSPLYMPDLADEHIRGYCVDDRHAELIRRLGTRSLLIVPLVAREAQLGALTLASPAPRRFSAADIDLAGEIGRRAAMAIDNARLLVETQRAVRLRDQFLSVASHELRTPVTSLKLRVESLLRGAESGRQRDSLERVSHSVRRLQRLIDELLDVTRIEQGQMTMCPAEVELGALVSNCAEQLELDVASARCTLSIERRGPVVGTWDGRRLDQVVTNLLSNAIKFGAGRPIEVVVRDAGDFAELTVRDHGIGIDLARVPYVFDRFERAVSAVNYGGLGLGLYLARSIVESHGGTIQVQSQVGEGSTFTVRLPRAPPAA
jgi:predicted ATPase/signal transduction histidine kinase